MKRSRLFRLIAIPVLLYDSAVFVIAFAPSRSVGAKVASLSVDETLFLGTPLGGEMPVTCLNSANFPRCRIMMVPTTAISGNSDIINRSRRKGLTSTQLNVWWFGGSDVEHVDGKDSCELVAVRIEAPTPNSRRIQGEIMVEDTPLDDVWAVLTDYDELRAHVPNLVESRRIASPYDKEGRVQGDGRYRCRLHQKGAQKIIGFDFGASVTLDMAEAVLVSGLTTRRGGECGNSVDRSSVVMARHGRRDPLLFPPERKIEFRCVESSFFKEFDGSWRVQEILVDGKCCCRVTYSVLVKPKGPVPVAALEWRIREDVPTNLRAIKRASIEVGYKGVMARRAGRLWQRTQSVVEGSDPLASLTKSEGRWDEDETMAVYLNS